MGDIVVGPRSSSGDYVYIVWGKSGTRSADVTTNPSTDISRLTKPTDSANYNYFGFQIGCGNTNGDAYADIVTTIYLYTTDSESRALVLLGSNTRPTDTAATYSINWQSSSDFTYSGLSLIS